ncbi:MAG: divalent-cation tolerance protein CutA [Leptolyngbyaceae cyanobacterium CSU_1_3]|nr:divalent-cation tolerance protein CutA [Leptolyngbyaceae cyanobacterium CSU_1_3]
MAEETECCVVLVTTTSRQEAETIAQVLVQEKLAACATLLPVESVYRWQGAVHQGQEWQLLIKTERSRFLELAAKIQAIHSYEVPEIIALPILAGSQSYLQWISEQVHGDS